MLELYHNWGATCGRKTRLVFVEKGIDYVSRIVDTQKGEQFDPAYLKLNPNAYVPTLVHDGRVLIESTIIMNYIDDAFEGPALKPTDPYDRARMAYRIKMIDEKYHTAINAVSFVTSGHARFGNMPEDQLDAYVNSIPDAGRRRQRRNTITMGFEAPEAAPSIQLLDKMLDDLENKELALGPWLAGDAYSLGDAAMTPYLQRLEEHGWQEMWTKNRPRVTDWWARVKERPSFQTAIQDHIDPARAETLKALGVEAWPKFQALLAA